MPHVQTGENLHLQGKCLLKKVIIMLQYAVDSKSNDQQTTKTHVIIPHLPLATFSKTKYLLIHTDGFLAHFHWYFNERWIDVR